MNEQVISQASQLSLSLNNNNNNNSIISEQHQPLQQQRQQQQQDEHAANEDDDEKKDSPSQLPISETVRMIKLKLSWRIIMRMMLV